MQLLALNHKCCSGWIIEIAFFPPFASSLWNWKSGSFSSLYSRATLAGLHMAGFRVLFARFSNFSFVFVAENYSSQMLSTYFLSWNKSDILFLWLLLSRSQQKFIALVFVSDFFTYKAAEIMQTIIQCKLSLLILLIPERLYASQDCVKWLGAASQLI